jgi:hypothetical protein
MPLGDEFPSWDFEATTHFTRHASNAKQKAAYWAFG